MRSFHEKGGFAFTSLLAATSGFCVMRSLILLPIAFLFCYTAKAQAKVASDRFILNGRLEDRDTGRIILSYADKDGNWISDTAKLSKGSFSFTGKIKEPTLASLQGHRNSRSVDDPDFTEIFLEPVHMNILVRENDFKHASVLGSRTQQEMDSLNKKKAMIYRENSPGSAIKSGSVQKQLRDADLLFIQEHPDSYVSAYLLTSFVNRMSGDSVESLYSTLSLPVQNSLFGMRVHTALAAEKATTIGSMAPDFSQKEIGGNTITLSSFRGKKYVLIDFWASWCAPCRDIVPELKELHQQYTGKGLVIIGISLDMNKPSWKKAIAEDGIASWKNIFGDLSHTDKADNIIARYNVQPIPDLFLIDSNGVIIGRYRSAPAIGELKQKLAEVFR